MKQINPAIDDMLAHKKLSNLKLEKLIFLKKLVDKVASKPYLPDSEVKKIENKFGVKPDVITWGDYFQTHTASEHWEKSDQEFNTIINTIHFDLIASVMIFANKSNQFFTDVEDAFQAVVSKSEIIRPEDEEITHLHILMTYYKEMGLKMSSFDSMDFDFFQQYSEERAVS